MLKPLHCFSLSTDVGLDQVITRICCAIIVYLANVKQMLLTYLYTDEHTHTHTYTNYHIQKHTLNKGTPRLMILKI